METYLALASLRARRRYSARPIPEEVVERILDAGRVSGSSRNRQPWKFLVLRPETVARVTEAVWEPANLRGAALVVAVVTEGKGPVSFDAGRAAENMMLAAWDAGVGSSPNGPRDAAAVAAALGLVEGEEVATILSFGYPEGGADPGRRPAEEWVAKADRRPRDQVVRQV
jgi:nitroreductase